MRKATWKKWISVLMVAVMLACSIPDMVVSASNDGVDPSGEESVALDGTDSGTTDGEELYQYINFSFYGDDITITVPELSGVTSIEGIADTTVYRVNLATVEMMTFEASVALGNRLSVSEELRNIVIATEEPVVTEGQLVYTYGLQLDEVVSSEEEPLTVELLLSCESVSVKINGNAVVSGVDENGLAKIGEEISVEITEPGYALAKLTKDEKGNDVYTAMELDYNNRYVFTAEEGVVFYVVDPEQVDYTILNSADNKSKITGVDGIKLVSLDSAAQGFDEIVLDFTAVKNGSDGTETENVYYEVKVNAVQGAEGTLPAGSSTTPKYYYIPKVKNDNTQSKSIKVNDGVLSAPTAATYEFSVRMVYINKTATVPDEDEALSEPLAVNLTNNTITKQFSTKNPYFEDKLGFVKKNTKVFSGQQDVLVGNVKYSANASYLHDITAVAYDSNGVVCEDIICEVKNDNDELYVSVYSNVSPGKYTITLYASVGEEATVGNPQGGTMYQATTSVALTVQAGIDRIEVVDVPKQVGVNSKNVSFTIKPVGYGYYGSQKAVKQKFSYKIWGADCDANGYKYSVYPVDNVRNNITIDNKGKVTINKSFYVDEDPTENLFAIEVKAEDFEGNDTTSIVYIEVVSSVSVPTKIYLTDSDGYRLGTTLTALAAQYSKVVVLDQFGNNMNQNVKITPNDNKSGTAAAYVYQSSYNGNATLYVRKCSNITIKATTKDGTKKSISLKVKITKPRVSNPYYSISNITYKGTKIYDYSTYDGYMTYNAPKGSVITFRQGMKYDGYTFYNDWYNWGYRVTGGKLKVKNNVWTLTPTERTATVYYWDKANPKKYWYVKFTNYGWDTSYEKAPKLTLTEGKLYSTKYSNWSDVEYVEESWDYFYIREQILTYEYDYGSYDEIRISRVSSSGPNLYVYKFDPRNRRVLFYTSSLENVKTGSFKYAVSFYNDGELMCKPTYITVKVNKSSKLKVSSSYTFDTASSNGVKIKCNVKNFYPDFDKSLLNANVGGKPNDFNQYFEVVYEVDGTTGQQVPVIKFKSTVTAAQKEALKGTTQTGYVRYEYFYGYDYIQNQTAKISIKVK